MCIGELGFTVLLLVKKQKNATYFYYSHTIPVLHGNEKWVLHFSFFIQIKYKLIKHKLVIEYASVLLYRVNLLGSILGTDHWHKRKEKFSLPFLAYEVNT